MTMFEFFKGAHVGKLAWLEQKLQGGYGRFLFPDGKYRDAGINECRLHFLPKPWADIEQWLCNDLARCTTLRNYYLGKLKNAENDPLFIFYFQQGVGPELHHYTSLIQGYEEKLNSFHKTIEHITFWLIDHRQEKSLMALKEAHWKKSLNDFRNGPSRRYPKGEQGELF